MGPTRLGKSVFVGFGLLGLIALVAYVSGGERGAQIYTTSILIIIISVAVFVLVYRIRKKRQMQLWHLGPTMLGKSLFVGFGLVGLIAFVAYVSDGERGAQIYTTSILITIVSVAIYVLIYRIRTKRQLFGDAPIMQLWDWETTEEKHEKQYREEQTHQEKNQDKKSSKTSEPEENPYDILAVPKNATIDEIKKAKREKTLKFHPDKESSSLADNFMKQINWAYGELSDPKKRIKYA